MKKICKRKRPKTSFKQKNRKILNLDAMLFIKKIKQRTKLRLPVPASHC